jgi:deoxyribonuclease IV
VSIAGGLVKAIDRGVELGCEVIQIFVKNNTRWIGRPLADDEARAFRSARRASPLGAIVGHATYLINLATAEPVTLERSREALVDELDRCQRLGLDGLVLHPGAHLGAGTALGLERAVRSLDAVLDRVPHAPTLLLETTAGQGSALGSTLGELAAMRTACSKPERLGICIDTCHAFAAGYPLHEPAGYEAYFAEFDATIGLGALGAIHLNDSQGALGSRRDRHANIGEGEIGRGLFSRMVRDPALAHVPMLLETPRGEDGALHRADLELLVSLRRG